MRLRSATARRWAGVLLIGLLASAATAAEWVYREHTRIDWRSYGPEVFAEAERRDRPVLIVVYADWCHWCRKYETEVLERERVRERIASAVVPVLVDQARRPELAAALGAERVPTTLLATPDRRRLVRFSGLLPVEDFLEILDSALRRWEAGETAPTTGFEDPATCCPLEPPSRGRDSGAKK